MIDKKNFSFRSTLSAEPDYLDTPEKLQLYSACRQTFNLYKLRPKAEYDKVHYYFIAEP